MLGRKRGAVLSYDLEAGLAWNEKDETSRFALWVGLAYPTVAQLTAKCYHVMPSLGGLEWSASVLRTPLSPPGGNWEGTGF
jgi:hypothetical protein